MRVLDLCSGLGGWSDPWREAGHDVTTLDLDPRFGPEARTALEIVGAVLGVIRRVRPRAAVIENPRALLRQLRVLHGPRTVWYCHYGERRAKPTDLWTFGAADDIPFRPECHNRRPDHDDECCCADHNAAPRGSVTGTQGMPTAEAAKVPDALAVEVLDYLTEGSE